MKTLNHWSRKIHRWLSIPLAVTVITMTLGRETSLALVVQRIQPPLMLIMALTGIYLYLLPYIVRQRRARHGAAGTKQVVARHLRDGTLKSTEVK